MTDFLWLRRLVIPFFSLLWVTMGSAAALVERSDFGHATLAANSAPIQLPGNGFSIWAHPERALPSYTPGGPTSGVMVPLNPPGLPVYLNSGPRTGARFPFSQADGHVETSVALQMSQRGITEARVFHNNTNGTCGNCDYYIPTFLQPGSTLHVVPRPDPLPQLPGGFHFQKPIPEIPAAHIRDEHPTQM